MKRRAFLGLSAILPMLTSVVRAPKATASSRCESIMTVMRRHSHGVGFVSDAPQLEGNEEALSFYSARCTLANGHRGEHLREPLPWERRA